MPTTENCSKGLNGHSQDFRQHKGPMTSPKGSKWRPALRKLKDGIFSRKDSSRFDIRSPGAPLPLNETNRQRLDQRIQPSTEVEDTRNSFHSSSRESSRTAISSQSSQYSVELKDSKGYNFFRRRLSIPTKKVEAAKNEHVQSEPHEREYTDPARPSSSTYVPKDPGKRWEHDPFMHRPSTAAYIPQHAASDFNQTTIGTYASQEQITWFPLKPDHPVNVPVAAVAPDDSSGDFQEFLAQARAGEARTVESSRLHSPNKILSTPAEKRTTGVEANYRLTVKDRPTTSIPSASRRGSLFEHVAEYIKPSEVEANHCLAVRDRPTTSIPSASRRGSLFEHVADYIKPSEAGGVRRSMEVNRRPVERSRSPLKVHPNPPVNQRTSLSRPLSKTESFLASVGGYIKPANQNHLPGSLNKTRTCTSGNLTVSDAHDKREERWSTMTGFSRRSFSQERDCWKGSRRRGSHPVESSTSSKHRSSGMPTSPGLDRYNRGVRMGLY
jgi:hypothetical protein